MWSPTSGSKRANRTSQIPRFLSSTYARAEPVRPRPDSPKARPNAEENEPGNPTVPLALVLKACPEVATYHAGPMRGWTDLVAVADRIAPWLGIDAATWRLARASLGPATAAATLAAMLQRASAIRNPGGYLRSLADRHAAGRFALAPMIHALLAPAPG